MIEPKHNNRDDNVITQNETNFHWNKEFQSTKYNKQRLLNQNGWLCDQHLGTLMQIRTSNN